MSNINQLVQEMISPQRNVIIKNPYKINIGGDDSKKYEMKRTEQPGIKPTEWQKEITSAVIDKDDLFINIAPSAGKTMPIKEAWKALMNKSRLLGISIPKLVWVCETKILAQQVYMDFRETIIKMFQNNEIPFKALPPALRFPLETIEKNPDGTVQTNPDGTVIKKPTLRSSRNIQKLHNALERWIKIHIGAEGVNKPRNFQEWERDDCLVLICTYEPAVEYVKSNKVKLVIIDEIQERFKTNQHDPKKIKALKDTLRNMPPPPNCAFILLTGSMNPKVTEYIKNFINKYYGRRLRVINEDGSINPSRGETANRGSINVTPINRLNKHQELADLVQMQVKNKESNNVIIIFSVAGEDPYSKFRKAIFPICNTILSKTTERDIHSLFNIRQKSNWEPRMSKGQIGKVVLDNMEDDGWLYQQLQYMLKGVDEKGQERDSFLGRCILHGFGYICTGSKFDANSKKLVRRNVHLYDIKVVEALFKQKKISTIFATDSVGVGVNLEVGKLFIPNLNKFSGPKLGHVKLDDSSLIQLIHRAGRQLHRVSTIFCTVEDMPRIMNFIYHSNPSADIDPSPLISGTGKNKFSELDRRMQVREEDLLLTMKKLWSKVSN